ncbi:hypothetical protein [Puia dinghuensis]|uniref:Transposase (putative) YhgA-like domain-containing protein n=1 Tax=Puia dinghuensis TaxID=1792502 RepID=A0A8J2UIR3_9BACT|nr:hypothetical protein [Puia dinghuensis]GGB23049.1 hypothetical protein GCM10011511_53720 [Puia dinghuensis]
MRPKYDKLWKGILEVVIKDLLLFVEPDIEKYLDLQRGFEFLDKELVEMDPQPDKPSNTRVVDKLVKAYLRDGAESWMLLHVEVQGNKDGDFARRMFEYFIRLLSKYEQPVAAIAVFSGRDGKKMPAAYEDRCLWMRARYEYKTLCITDYPDEVLQTSLNPFATVLMVAKEVLLRVKDTKVEWENALYEHKVLVARLIKERMAVYGRRKTRAMMIFLHNYVVFESPEMNHKFIQQTDEIFKKKNTMGYFECWGEIRHEEGVEEGHEKGLKEGFEKAVRSLLTNTKFSTVKIAAMLEVPVSRVRKIKRKMNAELITLK